MPIFRVKSVKKITPAKKNLHGFTRGARDKYEVWLTILRPTANAGHTKCNRRGIVNHTLKFEDEISKSNIKIRSRIEDNVNKSPGKVGEQPSNFPQSGIASNQGRKLHLLPAAVSAAAYMICKEFLKLVFYFNVLFRVPENCTAPAD